MELKTERIGKYMLVSASGRLDASWAEYFADVFLNYIRNGDHHLVIDAAAMEFLSSAGIRSLLRINKELNSVKGSFMIVNATQFVSKTLQSTGFGMWLSGSLPADMQPASQPLSEGKTFATELYELAPAGSLHLSVIDAWQPWNAVDHTKTKTIGFPSDLFALGVGSSSTGREEITGQYGEFMAVCGNLAYQAPDEKGRPDYLLGVKEFIPEMLVIEALMCKGEMSHLFRFAPEDERPETPVSKLAAQALAVTGSNAVAFVIIAEAGGIVGAKLIQSPGKIGNEPIPDSIEMRNWLSFCGERVFSGEQTIVFGIAARGLGSDHRLLLRQLPSNKELYAHAHAIVFPYQPLPNGKIDLRQQVEKFFSGPPPIALMHLIDDNRPVQGLGESSLIRGACWCAPLKNLEGQL